MNNPLGKNQYAGRTHCKHGHEYVPENIYLNNGRRVCKTCHRAQIAKNYVRRTLPGPERLAKGTIKTDSCWIWQKSPRRGGYGSITVNGKSISTHRYAYELANGPILNGLFVLHRCDTPKCVNPAHLFLGTSKENMLDMVSKNRSHQQQKTHCPHGHEYSVENTRYYKGARKCRACATKTNASRAERKKQLKNEASNISA